MKIKSLFLSFVSIVLFSLPKITLAADLVLPDPLDGKISSFAGLIETITTYISGIIGTLAVLMFVIAGIYFVTSGGNSSKIQKAKDIVIWTSIGVGVVLAASGLIALVRQIIAGP